MYFILSLYHRAHRKLKKEGFAGIWRVAKRMIAPFFSGMFLNKTKSDLINILYVIGYASGESKRYRIYNIIEALSLHGIIAQAVYQESLLYIKPNGYSAVVFFRCKMNMFTSVFLMKCRHLDIPAIYDIDDLLFDENFFEKLYKEDQINHSQYKVYIYEARKYKSMLKVCDYATASTIYLCDYMRGLAGLNTFHIPNSLNQLQINAASAVIAESSSEIKIGFLSGSSTHNRDFEQAATAIVSILGKYAHVSLVIVGWFDLPSCLEPFRNRILHVPFMDYIALLKFCCQLYAVIVPLEHEVPFCNAKSELKYFEQALIGVPVIASPTQTYKECITDGVNGLLAVDAQQWESALERLITDRDFRDTLAENARLQIREIYYPDKIGETANAVYREILTERRARK